MADERVQRATAVVHPPSWISCHHSSAVAGPDTRRPRRPVPETAAPLVRPLPVVQEQADPHGNPSTCSTVYLALFPRRADAGQISVGASTVTLSILPSFADVDPDVSCTFCNVNIAGKYSIKVNRLFCPSDISIFSFDWSCQTLTCLKHRPLGLKYIV